MDTCENNNNNQPASEKPKLSAQPRGQGPFVKLPKIDKQIDVGEIRQTTIRWSLFLLGYLFALLAFAPLVKATVEAFSNASYMKWVTLGIAVTATLLSGFLVYQKRSGWIVLRVPLFAFAVAVFYAAMRYPTTDVRSFSLLQMPVEALLNPIFLIVILAAIIALWIRSRFPLWLKSALTVLMAYCASAFIYGMLVGVGLEESFLGADFFGYIPCYFFQPAYLTIQFVFPALFFLSIVIFISQRNVAPVMARIFLGLAIVLFLTEAIGFTAMYRNRVPNLFSCFIDPGLGVGEAQTTFTDPSGHVVSTRIATKNFKSQKNNEAASFYTMALSYIPPATDENGDDKKNDGSYQLNLSVKDAAGKDVLFLSPTDFDLYQNGVQQKNYTVDFEIGGVKTGQNVILLLDHSGSMGPVMDQLKLAAKAFIDLKSHRDKILLIPFGSSPAPQPVSSDKQELKDQIDNMPNGGGTNLLTSIIEGFRLSQQFKGPTTMVAMTDGKAGDKNRKNMDALMDCLKRQQIRVYSVGLGESEKIDETFLANLAKQGGGKYFQTEDAGQLKRIYQSIGAELQSKYTLAYEPQIPPPVVQITAPEDGGLVFSTMPFTAQVPNIAQAGVEALTFYVDDTVIAEKLASDQRSYSIPFDPTKFSTGPHRIEVVAQTQSGQKGQDSIEIDIQPPAELSIVSPRTGDRVGESADIDADLLVRSDQPPASVSFTVDGQQIGAVKAPPFTATWDTRSFAAGEHEIIAHSRLADGTTVEDTVKVMVVKEMTIAFAKPANWKELGGNVPLAITIVNEDPEDPVARVRYTLNDKDLGVADGYPFDYQMDAAGLAPGTYTIRAEAITGGGKVAHAAVRGTVSTGYLVVGRRGEAPGAADTGTTARFFFPPRNVEIILDASNSMWGQLAEGSKIDIAKQVLAKIVAMIPPKTQVALRVYGNGSPVKRGDCKDSQLLMPLSPLRREKLLKQIRSIIPRGKTPIAYSINQSPKDLAEAHGDCVVLLITDGIESCDGDPVAAAAMLKKAGIKMRLHVIGYDVGSDTDRATLTRIAQAGGGAFFSAASGAELTDAIVEAATVNFRVVDSREETVLKSVVGNQRHELKIGTYNVIIDLDSPQELLAIQISKDRTTKITMIQDDDEISYELID